MLFLTVSPVPTCMYMGPSRWLITKICRSKDNGARLKQPDTSSTLTNHNPFLHTSMKAQNTLHPYIHTHLETVIHNSSVPLQGRPGNALQGRPGQAPQGRLPEPSLVQDAIASTN